MAFNTIWVSVLYTEAVYWAISWGETAKEAAFALAPPVISSVVSSVGICYIVIKADIIKDLLQLTGYYIILTLRF